MSDLGRILIGLGILLIIVGVFFVISSRLNLPLGRLPGDFSWRGKGWAVSSARQLARHQRYFKPSFLAFRALSSVEDFSTSSTVSTCPATRKPTTQA
jgi:hypothetical protein